MKKLRFHYEMQLTFDAAVAEHHFLFRFLPMKENGQECYGLRYGIEPSGKLHELTDGFGNRTCAGEAMEPHNSLEVWAEGTVFVDRSKTRKEDCHLLFSFPSAYTKADKALVTYLEERSQIWKGEKTEENSDMDFLFFLMNGLYQEKLISLPQHPRHGQEGQGCVKTMLTFFWHYAGFTDMQEDMWPE